VQIEAIAVYHRDGRAEPRVVKFRTKRLNVVTGVPSRGKSALLEIVDYCMGRRDFTVPEGVVRDTSSWYGVALTHEGERTWALRPEPKPGRETTSDMMLIPDALEAPPRFEELAVNADRKAVRAHLDARLGIDSGEIRREEWRLRSALHVSVAQAILLCLQGQNEVMNKTLLFHRQADPPLADDLEAALPFFLGAVDPETPALHARLTKARRVLERARRRLAVAESAAERADERVASLLERAVAAQLPTGEDMDPLRRLRDAADATLDIPPRATADNEASRLLKRRSELAARRRDLDQQLATLRVLDADARAFAGEAGEQAARLRSLELLPEPSALGTGAICPVCGSDAPRDDASAADFHDALETLQQEIAQATGFAPRASRAIERVELERAGVDDELSSVAGALHDLAAEGNQLARHGEANQERAFVQGRIAEYLDLAERASATSLDADRRTVRSAELLVAELEEQLDEDLEQERIDAALDELSEPMTRYARALQVEHVDEPARLRLNLDRMTAVARTPGGTKWLPKIGGGSNWLGWHLAVHLGLHTHFIANDRPVPRFLMLDQPTQAWYPEDLLPGEVPDDQDVDRVSVRRMFRLLYDVANETGLQIIVCDHAKLVEDPWFMDSLEHDWRGADGLIPASWR
jgi:hypothetical protein